MNGRYYGKREIRWHSREKNRLEHIHNRKDKMKALVEIVLIWGIVLALVLAAFLLNFWLIHRIDLLVGVNATRAIISIGALMATIWILGIQ